MDLQKRRSRRWRSAQQAPEDSPDLSVLKSGSGADDSGEAVEQPSSERIEHLQGLLRQTGRPAEGRERVEHAKEPAARRVAKTLLLMGKEQAAEVLRHLSSAEIERVAAEIARVKTLTREEAHELAGELGACVKRARRGPQGGPDTALQFLMTAFGTERGENIFGRAVGQPARRYFEFLEELEPAQVTTLLKNEAPPVVSAVMAWLPASSASKVLQGMPVQYQREVVKRLWRMQKIDSTVLRRIEEALKEKIRRQGRVVSHEIDGQSTVAAILRHMDSASGEGIIERIRREEPELAAAVEQQLFTIESVLYIEDAGLQEVLRGLGDAEIALVMKGKREEIRAKLLHNLSRRRGRLVVEEYQRLGAVPRRKIDAATDEFVGRLRILESEGRLKFIDRHDMVE